MNWLMAGSCRWSFAFNSIKNSFSIEIKVKSERQGLPGCAPWVGFVHFSAENDLSTEAVDTEIVRMRHVRVAYTLVPCFLSVFFVRCIARLVEICATTTAIQQIWLGSIGKMVTVLPKLLWIQKGQKLFVWRTKNYGRQCLTQTKWIPENEYKKCSINK